MEHYFFRKLSWQKYKPISLINREKNNVILVNLVYDMRYYSEYTIYDLPVIKSNVTLSQ